MPKFVDSGYVKSSPTAEGVTRQLWDTEGNIFVGGISLENALVGVGSGYKIARGTITPTSGSHTVVTGLDTVVAAVASLKGAPTLTCLVVAADIGDQDGAPAAGSILIKTYKPTSSSDVTPVAATTPWSAVDWIAVGT